jgi:hypothetical protein
VNDIEELTKEVEKLGRVVQGGDYDEHEWMPVHLSYCSSWDLTKTGRYVGEPSAQDPWRATWHRYNGTGATAEMALMELRNVIQKYLTASVEFAEKRVQEAQDKLAKIRATLRQSPEREEP